MTPTAFARDLVEDLVVTCEEVLLDRPKRKQTRLGRASVAAWSALGGPIALVMQGMSQTRRPTVIVISLLAVIGLFINSFSQLFRPDVLRQLNAGWGALTVFALLLPIPSAIGFTAYSTQKLRKAYERLGGLASVPRDAIEPFTKLLDRAEQQAAQRLSSLKWMIGAAWAVVVYLGQRGFEAKSGDLLGLALGPRLLTVLSLGFSASYGWGVNAVFGLARALLAQRELDIARASLVTVGHPHDDLRVTAAHCLSWRRCASRRNRAARCGCRGGFPAATTLGCAFNSGR
jgi:hypothetical protein